MTERATFAAYVHIEGFDNLHRDAFDKRKVRAAMRKAGRLVANRAQLNLALAGGAANYPRKVTGVLRDSIKMRVSRSGFLVKVAPDKTAGMKDYYPAYLHYGVRQGASIYHTKGKKNSKAKVQKLMPERNSRRWRINPRGNYVADALEDEAGRVRAVLSAGFAAALR